MNLWSRDEINAIYAAYVEKSEKRVEKATNRNYSKLYANTLPGGCEKHNKGYDMSGFGRIKEGREQIEDNGWSDLTKICAKVMKKRRG